MRLLTLLDLKLGLADLLDKRRAALRGSAAGKNYEPMLAKKLEAIEALPPAILGGKALAAELDETDTEHDGLGAAIWHTTEAYYRSPRTSPEILDAAGRIRAEFIPTLLDLQASYADEADAAIARKKTLSRHKADLKLFPVAEGETLLDWVTAFLDAGERLNTLLSERADMPQASRKGAGSLRSATIGLLNRLRAGLADELAHDPKLPRDLDARVFGYFDQLHGPRLTAATQAKAKKKKDEAKKEEPKKAEPGASPE